MPSRDIWSTLEHYCGLVKGRLDRHAGDPRLSAFPSGTFGASACSFPLPGRFGRHVARVDVEKLNQKELFLAVG
jgi:hypothetical protein